MLQRGDDDLAPVAMQWKRGRKGRQFFDESVGRRAHLAKVPRQENLSKGKSGFNQSQRLDDASSSRAFLSLKPKEVVKSSSRSRTNQRKPTRTRMSSFLRRTKLRKKPQERKSTSSLPSFRLLRSIFETESKPVVSSRPDRS